MPGDPFRGAWRARLEHHRQARGIAWPIKDLDSTTERPDASRGFLDIEFSGGEPERLGAWGAPGDNYWDENGQVSIDTFCPLGDVALRDQADACAATLRTAFRADRFAFDRGDGVLLKVRITATAPLTTGLARAGLRVTSVLLGYHLLNRG